jgi:type VI secretion system protein ImpH
MHKDSGSIDRPIQPDVDRPIRLVVDRPIRPHDQRIEGVDRARAQLLAQVAETPYAFDFYQLLRRLESLQPNRPRFGEALRPAEESIRLAQEPSLSFAPSNVSALDYNAKGIARIAVRFLGLFGPQGPLPTHLTELARERKHSHSDPTLVRFADLFHHRLLLLFFRAWRQAQPTASHDQADQDRFETYLGSLFGQANAGAQNRDSIPDPLKRQFTAHLARSAKNADGLADCLSAYFQIPVRIHSFVTGWLNMPAESRTRLGLGENCQLGVSTVIGQRVSDCQHQFDIELGPMSLARYESFLPGQPSWQRLVDWVANYTANEFRWRAQLVLQHESVPQTRLGQHGRLGLTSWLGKGRTTENRRDLKLTPRTQIF